MSLDSTNTSLAVLDSILLRVTRSAHGTLLRAQPRESDLAPQADSESPITPQHLSRAHEDCSSNGLQSSVEWNQVELEGGKADLEVRCWLYYKDCSMSFGSTVLVHRQCREFEFAVVYSSALQRVHAF